MSERLRIMREAEAAYGWFVNHHRHSPELRDEKFNDLIGRYPQDGMVYFKRAQAYERVGEAEKAITDYKIAVSRFPMPEWKDLAREGIKYCESLPLLNRLPQGLRSIWGEALYIQVLPNRSLAMTARAALHRTANILMSHWQLTPRETLAEKMGALKKKVPPERHRDMDDVKGFGDAAAHGDDITVDQARKCFEASGRIVRYLASLKL